MGQAKIPIKAPEDFPPGQTLAEDIFHATMRPIYDFFDCPYPWDDPAPGPEEGKR